MGLRHGSGLMRYPDGTSFDGRWWKDRRLQLSENGPETVCKKRLYEKPYDFYFAEEDDLWERKYRVSIDKDALKNRNEINRVRKKNDTS